MNTRTKKLYVFRGLPGSGKSTAARSIGCLVIEPDSWHVQSGKYGWKRENHTLAHKKSYAVVEVAMQNEFDIAYAEVLRKKSMLVPLIQLSKAYGYEMIVFDIKITAEEAKERNTHGVSPDDIDIMAREWEDWV